jgi:hypothetical protein
MSALAVPSGLHSHALSSDSSGRASWCWSPRADTVRRRRGIRATTHTCPVRGWLNATTVFCWWMGVALEAQDPQALTATAAGGRCIKLADGRVGDDARPLPCLQVAE